MPFRIHVISDCHGVDIVGQLTDTFRDAAVTDFSVIADAALNIYRFAK